MFFVHLKINTTLRLPIFFLLITCFYCTSTLAESTFADQFIQQDDLYRKGQYRKALPLALALVESARRKFGANHTNYASAISRLALLHIAQGNEAGAEKLLKEALSIYQRSPAEQVRAIAVIWNNLGQLYVRMKRFDEAEKALENGLRSFSSKGSLSGKAGFPELEASIVNNLGELYRLQRKLDRAAKSFHRVIAIETGIYGRDHPALAISQSNLALVYLAQKQFGKAEPLLLGVLDTFQKAFKGKHPHVARALSNVGFLYFQKDDLETAERYLKLALEMRLSLYSAQHPLVIEVQSLLREIKGKQ